MEAVTALAVGLGVVLLALFVANVPIKEETPNKEIPKEKHTYTVLACNGNKAYIISEKSLSELIKDLS